MGYEHKTISDEKQKFAAALAATYYEKGKRPDNVYGLERLPQYDSERYSVWKQPNGQYLITIHGSKLDWHSISSDVGIAGGLEKENAAVQELFNKFDEDNITYDVAAHSLSTQYVVNAKHSKLDTASLFNPASSPFQDKEYLKESANDARYDYYINPSDVVSEGLWHQMGEEAVDRTHIGHYKWSPFAAHSVSQWYPDLKTPLEKEVS